MTGIEWQAASTVMAAQRLAHFVKTTQEDRLDWCPKSELGHSSRSALDQLGECIRLNRSFASVLRGEGPLKQELTVTDAAVGCKQVVDSARELASAIGALDEADLSKKFDVGFGQFPGAAVVSIPGWNMIYHCGQVNMIQMLYGDMEFHMPPME